MIPGAVPPNKRPPYQYENLSIRIIPKKFSMGLFIIVIPETGATMYLYFSYLVNQASDIYWACQSGAHYNSSRSDVDPSKDYLQMRAGSSQS
jgi:hypothetical protein